MKKVRYVRNEIKFSLAWDGTSTISKLREDLDAIEKLGANSVEIGIDWEYDGESYLKITPIEIRPETKEERRHRLNRDKRLEDDLNKRALELFQKLKLKFEKTK